MLETPSRIWRRIEAVEDRDMPSLPSLSFEDSVDLETDDQLQENEDPVTPHNEYDDQLQEDEDPVTPHHDYDDQLQEDEDPVTPHHDYDDQLQEDEDPVTHHDYDDQLQEDEDPVTHHDYDDQLQEDEDPVTPHHDYDDQFQEDEDLVTPHRDYDDQFQEDEDLVTPHHDYDDQPQEDEDPVTPHTRRRSFLLDIINSTARPRMKFPTPHPRKFGTPSITESTPRPGASSGGPSTPGPSLQSTFMGVTYRRPRMVPTRRMSHPLSQTISASSHEISESEDSPISGGNPAPRATPSLTSPHDGTSDHASFISTASSHDLTTHHRVNTSFDPAMGFGAGAPGHGVGRFNAAKLNNYLHGLNRRLQQENENLIERLKILEEEKKGEGASRRVSSVRTFLGNVQEDLAEGWLEEKAELGDMVEKFKTGLTTCMAEKKEVETALEQEKESRERDKERWRERMTEVEQGVSGIIAGLEQKLQIAEKQNKRVEEEASQRVKEMEKELVEIRGDRDVAMERAFKADRVIAGLEQKLQAAEKHTKKAEEDASQRVKEMEKELVEIRGDRDVAMERAFKAERVIAGLEQKLQAAEKQTKKAEEDASQRVKEMEKELVEIRGDRAFKAERVIAGLEQKLQAAVKQTKKAEEEASQRVKEMEKELEIRGDRAFKAERIIAGLEQKLQAAEKQTKKAEEDASQLARETAKELIEIRGDRDLAMERASKAERVLESGKDLGGALREANERVAQVMGDLWNAHAQIKELEEEIMRSDGRIDDLEKDKREHKDHIASEKRDVARTVASLEADLKRVRRDAEAFGQDLKLLRMENDKLKMKNKDEISKAERSKKQAQTQVRLLNEQLEMQKENVLKVRGEIKNNICAGYVLCDINISRLTTLE
jgi:hypothetical protein